MTFLWGQPRLQALSPSLGGGSRGELGGTAQTAALG